MSKSTETSNNASPVTPTNLITEELSSGVVNVAPRFDFHLNSIFSNMSKQDKLRLLKKSENDQIDELKQLYKTQFIQLPIESQRGIFKKLTYNNSQYDTYKLGEFLPTTKLVDQDKREEQGKRDTDYNFHKVSPRQQLLFISKQLLESLQGKYNQYEMEVKFGTRGVKRLTKQDYDNVIKKLKDTGFYSNQTDGYYCLKIQPEFIDTRTGEFK